MLKNAWLHTSCTEAERTGLAALPSGRTVAEEQSAELKIKASEGRKTRFQI